MDTVSEEVRVMLDIYNCIHRGYHFVYKEGGHSTDYVDIDPILSWPDEVRRLGEMLAHPFERDNIHTILAPATGGIALAYATARAMLDKVRVVWCDKDADGNFELKRSGFAEALRGHNVLAVEDRLSTGSSLKATIDIAKEHGAYIVGASAVCTGSITAITLDVPRLNVLYAVGSDPVAAVDCLQCAQGVPIVSNIGHPDVFRNLYPDYAGGFEPLPQK